MGWDIKSMEEKLNILSKDLNKSEEKLKRIAKNIYYKDTSNESCETVRDVLDEDEFNYIQVNEAYKRWISQYSKEYIEMSEWYYGNELPYDVYYKEFKKERNYLESPKGIQELYFLFIFFAMYQYTFEESGKMDVNRYIYV
tara:strand:+ start:338 stop:760 length:423 start_codon:yes stop_codon:yes gene_type:complete